MTDNLGTIGDFPVAGIVPISDSRFATHDIRLSSALCCLGFGLKLESQPVAITIDADREQRIITFFHHDQSEIQNILSNKISARDVELWWSAPGKYEIEGYDDALMAIHRVHVAREAMITLSKGHSGRVQAHNGQVATSSLHNAAIMSACEIKPIGYESATRRWIFGKGAELIANLIKDFKPKDRPNKSDLCIDWMLESLRYRDWLAKIVRNPENIPLIEMRDGKKILQISAGMDEREQKKWMSYL